MLKHLKLPRAKFRPITMVVLVGFVVVTGLYLLYRASATTPFIVLEPENGTVTAPATRTTDGTDNVIKFGPAYEDHIKIESGTYKTKSGSYGSLAPITSKGYAKMDIAKVADSATTPSATCGFSSAVDTKITWLGANCIAESTWQQQGVTGVGSSGWAARSDIIVVTSHNPDDSQSRIMVLNTTTDKYSYVYLVRPCDDADGYCDLGTTGACGTTHAGGIAWYKNNLFVADDECMIVFDVTNIYKDASGKLILPTGTYWERTTTGFKYSGIGLDTTGPVPQLMLVKHNGPDVNGVCAQTNIGRWNLNTTSGNIQLDSGSTDTATTAQVVSTSTVCSIQGLAYSSGMYIFSTFSAGGARDYAYRARTVASAPADTKFLWPYQNPEGIYIDTRNNTTWGVTELADSDGKVRTFSLRTSSIFD